MLYEMIWSESEGDGLHELHQVDQDWAMAHGYSLSPVQCTYHDEQVQACSGRQPRRIRRVRAREMNIPFPTFIICSTLAYNCTFAARRHHIPLPGLAVRRNANSL